MKKILMSLFLVTALSVAVASSEQQVIYTAQSAAVAQATHSGLV